MVGPETAPLTRSDHLRADADRILRAAIEGTNPYVLARPVLHTLKASFSERPYTIAAGKAAWPMAAAAVDVFPGGHRALLVTGPRGRDDVPGVEHVAGEHPLPGLESARAGVRALEIARRARDAGEPLLVLLSGGASAMLAAPAPGITLRDKATASDALMRAGASIGQLNAVRKHLSAVKGGRLAAAAGRCVTLAVSDVHDPPDDPATIASGPTVPDPTTYADALRVVEELGVEVSPSVLGHLEGGAAGEFAETVKPGDPVFRDSVYEVIASRHTAMRAASLEARRLGYSVHVVERPTRGEAREAGRVFAEKALAALAPASPACVIASGETTVSVRGSGTGGRNQEFVLGAAAVLASHPIPALLASIGTDGVDGPTDAAGAMADQTSLSRAGAEAIDRTLAENDAYRLLAKLGDLVHWGPTFTNVGDLHILITMGG